METTNNGMVKKHWNNIKTITMKAADEVIEVKKWQRKEIWFVEESRQAMDLRNKLQ